MTRKMIERWNEERKEYGLEPLTELEYRAINLGWSPSPVDVKSIGFCKVYVFQSVKSRRGNRVRREVTGDSLDDALMHLQTKPVW